MYSKNASGRLNMGSTVPMVRPTHQLVWNSSSIPFCTPINHRPDLCLTRSPNLICATMPETITSHLYKSKYDIIQR